MSDVNDNKELAVREESQPGIIKEYPVENPGIEEHVERYSDANDAVGDRAARQVMLCFGLAPLFALAFMVVYFAVPGGLEGPYVDFGPLQGSAQHMLLGLTIGIAGILIGVGAIQWARLLMADHELAEERHPAASDEETRQVALDKLAAGIEDSGITRRKMLGRTLLGALGLTAIAPLVTLADMGPWPTAATRKKTIERTIWDESATKPVRLVNDITYKPIKASDMEIGQLINGEPMNLKELHGPKHQVEKAKAAIIIVRMDPNSIKVPDSRKDWHVGGILAYSKICTHVGCPISLWEQQTHHLLCPCHQSTFDLGDSGKVVFGPAARALPQLPITVDEEGYLVARSDFTVPVGPSYPERDLYPEDKGE